MRRLLATIALALVGTVGHVMLLVRGWIQVCTPNLASCWTRVIYV